MSQLAQKLAKKGCTIEPPDIATLTTPSPAKKQRVEAAKHSSTNTRKMAPSKAIMKTPTPKKLQFAPSSGETESTGNVEQLFSGMTVDEACTLQTIKGVLPYSYVSGRWEDFDYSTDQMHGYALLRILLHSGIKEKDFEFDWEDEYTFVVKLKWPIFMTKVLMTTTLDKQEFINDKQESSLVDRFPRGHKLYDSMGRNVANLKDEDGDIWNVGRFTFKRPMKTEQENYEVKVFNVPCDKSGTVVCILQIYFTEDRPDRKLKKKSSKKVNITQSSIQLSKSSRGRSPTRTHSPRGKPTIEKKRKGLTAYNIFSYR